MLHFALLPTASKIQVPTIANHSTIFTRRIDRSTRVEASVLEVITSWKLQHINRSYKHEAYQKVKYKLDLIEQTIPWQNTFSPNDNYKRALNMRGNLVFRYRIYHPQAVLDFSPLLFVFLLVYFVSSFPFLIYKQLVRKEVFPVVTWNIANCSQSSKQWFHAELPNVLDRSFISVSFNSKLNSDSSNEKEIKWFLNKTWTF